MGRVVAVEFLSLDGVFEDPTWTQPYFDRDVAGFQDEAMRWADALLLGRVTYEGMSQAWPAQGDDPATGGAIMNSIRKYVPTATLTRATWNATLLTGDVARAVGDIRTRGENLLIYGSGLLGETLRRAGLVDEYRLIVCPVVLGAGRKLFSEPAASRFTTTGARTTSSGAALLTLTA